MIKKIITVFLLCTMFLCSAYRRPFKYTIKPEKDAYYHNSLGLNYLQDRIYYAAVQEFKIAISLSPSTQASAIFKSNLGDTYMFIGYPEMARPCYEDALKLYGLNFKYYQNLIKCYMALGITETKKREFQASDNLYDKIKLGLLYVETGETRKGVNVLDDICTAEPDILINSAIKQYLKDVTEKMN